MQLMSFVLLVSFFYNFPPFWRSSCDHRLRRLTMATSSSARIELTCHDTELQLFIYYLARLSQCVIRMLHFGLEEALHSNGLPLRLKP